MNYKTTIVLVVLVAAVALWVLVLGRGGEPEPAGPALPDAEAAEGRPVLEPEVHAADVHSIHITTENETRILTRRDGGWWETAPGNFPLAPHSVDSLLRAATGLRYTDRIEAGAEGSPAAGDLGLQGTPRATVALFGEDERPLATLHLGGLGLAGRAYVTDAQRQHAYVVPDSLHRMVLQQPLSSLRRRTLDAPTAGQAERVVLERDGQATELAKRDGRWWLADGGRADAEAVQGLLSALSSISIAEFIDDAPADPARYGLASPEIALAVTAPAAAAPSPAGAAGATQPAATAPARTSVLRIGAPTNLSRTAYFATWAGPDHASPAVFTVRKADVDRLALDRDKLRDPRVTELTAGDVRELRVERVDQEPIHLERTIDGWRFGDPHPGFEPEEAEVTALVEAITTARAAAFTAPAGEPVAVVTLHAAGGTQPQVLRVYESVRESAAEEEADAATQEAADAAEPAWVVVRDDEGVGYQVPREQLAPLVAPIASLRSREVLSLRPDHIARFRIRQGDEPELLFERDVPAPGAPGATQTQPAASAAQPGRWRLAGGGGFEADALREALNHAAMVRAADWSPPPAEGEPWPIEVELGTADGTWHRLRLDGRSGRMEVDDQATFTAEQGTVRALTAELRDRTVLPLTADQIDSVTVIDGEREMTIRRTAEGRVVAADGGRVNTTAAGALLDALAGLRVERYRRADAAAPPPEGEPRRTLVITTREGAERRLVLLGDADEGKYLARLDGIDSLLVLSPETAETLSAEVTASAPTPSPF